MSNKSRNRKIAVRAELEKVPDGSLADLVKVSAPEIARKLDPRAIRLLGSQQVTEVMQHSVTATMFSGPLPPPEQLAKFEATLPGCAERILQMAEKQAEHRQRLEMIVIPEQQKQSGRGQIFGFWIGITGIAGAAVTGTVGEGMAAALAAVAIAGGALGVLTVSFIWGKAEQKKQLADKTLPANRSRSSATM